MDRISTKFIKTDFLLIEFQCQLALRVESSLKDFHQEAFHFLCLWIEFWPFLLLLVSKQILLGFGIGILKRLLLGFGIVIGFETCFCWVLVLVLVLKQLLLGFGWY